MTTSRRDVLKGGGKAVAAAAVAMTASVPAKAAQPDPLREGVQALVNEIRQDLGRHITMGEFWRLQEVADRLETLPGIQSVPNEQWLRWKPRTPPNFGMSMADIAAMAEHIRRAS